MGLWPIEAYPFTFHLIATLGSSQAKTEFLKKTHEYLNSSFDYYKNLSTKGKRRFMGRLLKVMQQKIIVGKDGLELNAEMHVLTCAAFVQITFGLRYYLLPEFKGIELYPGVYEDPRLKKRVKGTTLGNGVIRMSWKHLVDGYRVGDDSINLALHELAHAVKISVLNLNTDLTAEIGHKLADFSKDTKEIRSAILEGKIQSIRKYASTNAQELFACSVEYFFEEPSDFKAKLPGLFRKISFILGQDTTNVSGDYKLKVNRIRKVPKYTDPQQLDESKYSWALRSLWAGTVLSPVLITVFTLITEINVLHLFIILSGLFFLSVPLFHRKLVASGYMDGFGFRLFSLFGWAGPVLSLSLALNYFIPVHYYAVVETNPAVQCIRGDCSLYVSESEFPSLRDGYNYLEIDRSEQNNMKPEHCFVLVQAHYGLFGFKVIDQVSLVSADLRKDQYND